MMKRVCPRCLSNHAEPIDECPNPIYDKDYQDEVILEPRRLTISPARVRISELLKCPVDWQAIAPDQGISISLERFWEEVAADCLLEGTGLPDSPPARSVKPRELAELSDLSDEEFEVLSDELRKIEGETFDVYFQPLILETTDEEDLVRQLPNIEAWIVRARAKVVIYSCVAEIEKVSPASNAHVIVATWPSQKTPLLLPKICSMSF
jgi:hypothetical protein